MDKHELKTWCLGLPGASEEFPFNDEVSSTIEAAAGRATGLAS